MKSISIDLGPAIRNALRSEGLHVIDEILAERRRQDEKWGEQNHDPAVWLAILTEEVGELAEAILFDHSNGDERNHTHSADMRTEAIQVAAVAVQFVQFLDRRALAEPAAPVAAEEGGER